MTYPRIIQGGMGAAVSSWTLANAVARLNQLGVVSGTALDLVLARRLQLGDFGGHLRDAIDHCPLREMAERIWEHYFVEGGKDPKDPFKSKPMPNINPGQALLELTVVSSYVEVFLAKRGHSGPVGINLLEKIQLPTLPTLYGAMLAGVDFVLMGAGIPRTIPGILDQFSQLQPAHLSINVAGALPGENYVNTFDPAGFRPAGATELKRPTFLAIISSTALAVTLAKRVTPPVDGFVIEGPTAGGHNAPPRGAMIIDEAGEPIYGPRDEPDLSQIHDLGLPFWMAGSYGRTDGLAKALAQGANGIQVGTAFAFCEESGLPAATKARILRLSQQHQLTIKTDHRASPTGFPFKVVNVEGTMSEADVMHDRKRICDLGYLRTAYRQDDGKVGYRCASEPIDDFLKKGGTMEDTEGRKCVCNGLMSTIGMGQTRKGVLEPELITAGNDVADVAQFLEPGKETYTAADVIQRLLAGVPTPVAV